MIATDADTPSDQLEWSVTDRRFVLQDSPDGNGKLLAVRAGQQFDFEAEQNSAGILPVSVLVWDRSNVAVLSIHVQLTDINDHHPVFAKSTLTVELASSTAHQPLWQAQATDQLTGDAGNDVFAVKASDGSSPENADRIKDFEDGVDKIGLTGSLRFADLTLTGNGSNTRITHSSGTLFEVENITPAQLSQEDFILLAEIV